MEGLFVVVVGMFIGVPAALILLVSIVVLLSAKGSGFAQVMRFVAPLLGVAYPLAVLALGAKTDFVLTALLFDAPVVVLAVVATVIAIRKSAP
jgi:hypothetical protein